MRTILLAIALIFCLHNGQTQIIDSQNNQIYGNEWIDYNKEYFKIPVPEDGVYRITYLQLKESGIDLDNVLGKDFRLFSFGKEVPVFTTTQGKFSGDDFIEFYGFKNRSKLDSLLYEDKSFIFNPEYSLFNDTNAYFLSWDISSTNKRYNEIYDVLPDDLPPAEQFYIHNEILVNHSYFNKPLRSAHSHLFRSNFDIGEGYGSKLQVENSFTLTSSDVFHSSIKPKLNIRYTTNIGIHNIKISVNGNLKMQENKNGLYCGDTDIELEEEDLREQITITLEGTSNSSFSDKNSVSVIKLKYAREFDFLNKSLFSFNIEPSETKKYIEIRNFNLENGLIVMYDITNSIRLVPVIENDTVKFVLPPSEKARDLVLVNLSKNAKIVSGLVKNYFVDYTKYFDKNYIIVSDKDRFYDNNNKNWVEEYANYRSSQQGGGYKTLIANINDIYDQFAYGIDRHNIALNNFILYLKDHFSNPEYVFIIGKGLEYDEVRTGNQLVENKDLFYVPTFGYPGSDNLLAARRSKNYPEIPIGRLAAKTPSQIALYLKKIKKHEKYESYAQTIEDKEWMKKVIHLVGGTLDIIKQIENNLNIMGEIIHNNKYGGDIHTFKRSSGNAQESVTKKIIDDINKGAGIVTFYGHSGITGTDFNLSNLKNNRFPVFYSLGCYSGNIHTKIKEGQSEEFVLDSTGVIAYVGTSGTGFTGSLARLGKKIYENTGELYGEGIGKIVQRSIKFAGENRNDIGTVTLNQQFTFHGDPAVSLYKHPGPDYVIDPKTVQVDSNLINSTDDFVNLNFDIVNLGYAVDDSLQIKIVRKIPDGTEVVTLHKIQSVKSRKNITIKLNTFGLDGVGENCLSIYLDPNNEIAELPAPEAEENNTLSGEDGEFEYCFEIVNNIAKPIFPREFGIVSDSNITLKASSLNFFVDEQEYYFQIDTTEFFNSPDLKTAKVASKGGILLWNPDIDFQNETVYYWRVSPDKASWQNSSFVYLESSNEGWNQSHYFQYLKDDFQGTQFTGRKLDFVSRKYLIKIIGKKYNPTNRKVAFVDGEGWGGINPKTRPTICILGWGPKYWFRNKSGHDFNSIQNSNKYNLQFVYDPKKQEQRTGIKELLEAMPDSMIVFLYTVLGDENQSLEPENWEEDSISLGYNLYSVLESYGAKKIRLMETRGTVPYALIFKKGKGVLQEAIGENINSVFELNQEATVNLSSGFFNSKPIGPSKYWDKLLWSEEITGDTAEYSYLIVHKLNFDLTKDIIIDTLRNEYELDLSGIDAVEFPYIKLSFFAYDRYKRDPPNINYWRVFGRGYPDAVLKENEGSILSVDTLNYGEDFVFGASVYNNSSVDMDSILVEYKISSEEKDTTIYRRYPPLKAFDTIDLDFTFPTDEIVGNNKFTVTVNANKEQREQYYFNNIGQKRFFVKHGTKTEEISVAKVYVYPNPFENDFTVDANFVEDNNLIKLISITGKVLFSTKETKGAHIININKQEIKNGVYFLEISNNKSTFVYKIIKLSH